MAKEIERKFLVKGDAWRSFAKGTTYRQGYLNSAKERTVRVRTADPACKRERIMTPRKIPLKVVTAPAIGVVLEAPPVLVASEHSVDYVCAVAPPFYCVPTKDKLMGS